MASFYLVLIGGVPSEFDGNASWATAKQAIAAAEEICACGDHRQRERLIRSCSIYAVEVGAILHRIVGRDETEELCSAEAKVRMSNAGAKACADDADAIVGPFLAYHASDFIDEVAREAAEEVAAERGTYRELVA